MATLQFACALLSLSILMLVGPGQSQGGVRQLEETAKVTLPGTLTAMYILVITCAGRQAIAIECRNVPTLESYFPPSGKRKRRATNFWTDPWGPSPSSSSNSWNFGSSFGPSISNPLYLCPTQLNQSAVYQFVSDGTNYPANAISTEITGSPVLAACLAREIVFDSDPPNVFIDAFFANSNASCPFQQLRLWNYQSSRFGSLCWVLQNFQEDVLYKNCLMRFPMQCKQKDATTSNSWGSLNSLWPSSSLTNSAPTQNINTCLTWYETVSLWAYCPSLPAGSRIVRDRIIAPKSCAPFSVPCPATPLWK